MKKQFELAAFSDEAGNPAEEQIAALKRNRVFCSELRNINGKGIATLSSEECRELKRLFDGEGIQVKTLGSPIGKVYLSDSFEKEMDRFLRVQENGQIFGAKKIRMFSFFRTQGISPEDGEKLALERLNALAERAELLLCHENEKDIYGDSWQFCRRISQEIPAIRAIFDPANYIQCGVETWEAWQGMKPYVDYLHLKDADASGTVVPCGSGVGHVPEILKEYREMGGSFATIEPHLFSESLQAVLEKTGGKYCASSRYESPDAAFDAAVEAVRGLLG